LRYILAVLLILPVGIVMLATSAAANRILKVLLLEMGLKDENFR
jgi:hypothetical protein